MSFVVNQLSADQLYNRDYVTKLRDKHGLRLSLANKLPSFQQLNAFVRFEVCSVSDSFTPALASRWWYVVLVHKGAKRQSRRN